MQTITGKSFHKFTINEPWSPDVLLNERSRHNVTLACIAWRFEQFEHAKERGEAA